MFEKFYDPKRNENISNKKMYSFDRIWSFLKICIAQCVTRVAPLKALTEGIVEMLNEAFFILSLTQERSITQRTSRSLLIQCFYSHFSVLELHRFSFSLIRYSYVAFFTLNAWLVSSFIFHSYTTQTMKTMPNGGWATTINSVLFRSGRLLQMNINNNACMYVWVHVCTHARSKPTHTNTVTHMLMWFTNTIKFNTIMTVIRSVRFRWCGSGSADYYPV